MDEVLLTDAVERYLRDEMSPEEKKMFDDLRRNNPEIDQMVVEHQFFLGKMEQYARQAALESTIREVRRDLLDKGTIAPPAPEAKVIGFWRRSRRTVAVAASIAGLTAIATSLLLYLLAPPSKPSEIKLLSLENELYRTKQQVNRIDHDLKEKQEQGDNVRMAPSKRDGTGFLVDGQGFLVTNMHIIRSADSVYVENTKGDLFKAAVVYTNDKTDVAILKINDDKFTPIRSLPYGIRKSKADLGEEVFTLGYPRSEIVYGKGYLSAKTGFNGDTLSYQVGILANPGNSGAPLFNSAGEVIGVVSGKQLTAEGVVFAVKAESIFDAVEELRRDSAYAGVKISSVSHVKNLPHVQQIRKIGDCVFIVKSY